MRHWSLALLALVAACSTALDIGEQSTKANTGVEEAHNRILLLNALRAAKRRPLYFTSIVSLTVPIPRASPSVTLALPLEAGAAAAAGSATVRAEVPSFNVAVLDSQKFITGITTPLKPALVRFYLDQGWSPLLFLTLVVREIDYAEGDGESRYVNTADRRADFDAFQSELRAMLACGLRLVEEDVVAGLETPALRLPDDATLLSALGSTARQGFIVVPRRDAAGEPTGEWQLARPRADVLMVFGALDAPACRALPAGTRERYRRSNAESAAAKGAVMDYPGPLGSRRPIRLMVRSPEAILHYLGELLRAAEEGDASGARYVPAIGERPIFRVTRGEARDAFVSVQFDGETYSVRSSPDEASSQSLSLVSLLISLQKEASELPITAPIRLIGP